MPENPQTYPYKEAPKTGRMLLTTLITYVVLSAIILFLQKGFDASTIGIFSTCCMLVLVYQFASTRFYIKATRKAAITLARYYLVHMVGEFVFCSILATLGTLILTKVLATTFLIGFGLFVIMNLIGESLFFILLEKKIYGNKNIQ